MTPSMPTSPICPTLPKSVLMDEFDEVVTDPRLRRRDLERFLEAADAGELYLDEYRIFSTSGTSGLVRAVRLLAGGVRPLGRRVPPFSGSPRGHRARPGWSAIGAPSPLHLSRQIAAALQAGRSGAPRLAVTDALPEMVAALNEYRPEYVVSYPTVLTLLAEEQLSGVSTSHRGSW